MGQPKKKQRTSTSKSKKDRKSSASDIFEETEGIPPETLIKKKNIDEHPLEIKQCLVVRYRDGSSRLARIIEREKSTQSDEWKNYVHYHDFNRRYV